MSLKEAIEAGDVQAVSGSGAVNELIVWGKQNELKTHPLHYVSDLVMAGRLGPGLAVQLIDALIVAGADVNYQADNGETALIGAASLNAEEVGLRLIEAGARIDLRGGFEETALHWAAFCGLEKLVAELLRRGGDRDLKDARYDATPLGWASHRKSQVSAGEQPKYDAVIALLEA